MTEPRLFLPFWYNDFDPLAWDTVRLGGLLFPGIASVTGPGLKRKIDVKKPKGSDGASLRDEGMEPARLEIELVIYNNTDWEDLQGKWSIITPRTQGGLRTPLTIAHPLTRLLNINTIYIDSIPVPDFDKADGFLTVRFSAIEWFPAPKPVKAGKGAGTGTSNSDEIDQFGTGTGTRVNDVIDEHGTGQGVRVDDPIRHAENGAFDLDDLADEILANL